MRVAVQYKDGKTEILKKVCMISKGRESDYFIRQKDDNERFIDAEKIENIVILEE